MPIVRIEYEQQRISDETVRVVANAIQGFAAEATGYGPADISVFATANQITVNAAPIEIYVYASFPAVAEEDMEKMLEILSERVRALKIEHSIDIPFNLSVVKMAWKFQLEV